MLIDLNKEAVHYYFTKEVRSTGCYKRRCGTMRTQKENTGFSLLKDHIMKSHSNSDREIVSTNSFTLQEQLFSLGLFEIVISGIFSRNSFVGT